MFVFTIYEKIEVLKVSWFGTTDEKRYTICKPLTRWIGNIPAGCLKGQRKKAIAGTIPVKFLVFYLLEYLFFENMPMAYLVL
jgi:hypothetical protein